MFFNVLKSGSGASTVVRTTALTNVSHSVGSDGVLVVSWDKYSGTLGMFGKYYVYVSNTVDGTYQKYSMSPTAYNTQSYRLGTYDSSKDYYIYVTAYACIPGYSEYFGTNYKELTCAQSPKYRILNTMTPEEQISITTAAISPISDKVYNGSAYTPAITITGIREYKDERSVTFNITARSIANASVSSISAQTYTGKAIVPSVVVKDLNKTLVAGSDYTITYSNNTNPGTATITITGKGNYNLTKKVTFTIKDTPSLATSSSLSINQSSLVIK